MSKLAALSVDASQASPPEPASFFYVPGRNRRRLVICDHASNRIPPRYGDLGLDATERQRHIAWDPGAAGVAESLAARLDCPLFLHGWSRLLIDPNRQRHAPDLVAAISDGTPIPGNTGLDEAEREHRWRHYHQPYHRAIAAHLDACEAEGLRPLLISVHSFTPEIGGFVRPWQAGVLWDQDPDSAQRLIAYLRDLGYVVGDNQPYSGRDQFGYSIEMHAVPRGLRHALIEIRQDLLLTPADQHAWAQRLAAALLTIPQAAA